MRFIELGDSEYGYYQINVDHIVWFQEIQDFRQDGSIVKLSDGEVIRVSQTVKEIYNAL